MHYMDQKLTKLVQENQPLFWSTATKDLDRLDKESVVETLLNYGNLENIKRLFSIMGIGEVADIFYSKAFGKRSNYLLQTRNYFELYFSRHAQKHS